MDLSHKTIPNRRGNIDAVRSQLHFLGKIIVSCPDAGNQTWRIANCPAIGVVLGGAGFDRRRNTSEV